MRSDYPVTEPPALTRRGINDARGFGPKLAEQLERQFAVAQPIQLSGSRVLIPVFRVECFRTGTPGGKFELTHLQVERIPTRRCSSVRR